MAAIRLKNITRDFSRDFRAVDQVSFDVSDREVVTIVGPSGCGKSTLLRIIAGLDFPTSGTVEIGDVVVNELPARMRNIAMVFQSYALYPHMTSFDNLALNLRMKKLPKSEIERRVRETARMLDIEEILQKKPRELSGGQRQRVAVGRALIRNPQVFLFDEPLSNLDALLRERVRHELKELFRKIQAAVVYVTHDQVEAMTLADRVVVLNKGKVQQIGTPEDLYRRPANRFVAGFIGSPSMNLIDVSLDRGVFKLGEGKVRTGLDWSGEAVAGVRPENVTIGESGIPAQVRWVEDLGSHCLVGVEAGGITLAATSARRPSDEAVQIEIDPENVHVFEKSTGENLVRERAGHPVGSQPHDPEGGRRRTLRTDGA